MAAEAKAKVKGEKAMRKAERAEAASGYGYMAMGGVALFFQALILCLEGYFWSGGFLFPLAALCWIKSMPRAFGFCLAVVGVAICIYELCNRSYTIVMIFTRHYEIVYSSHWIASFAFEVLGAVLAVMGIVVFPMAILKQYAQSTGSGALLSAEPAPQQAPEPLAAPPPLAPTPPRAPSPAVCGPPLQPAQLITQPFGQPQPILIAGPHPGPGQAGMLQPAGVAYVAYPPHSNRTSIPIQPLTGQPILAGQPIMFPNYGPPPPYMAYEAPPHPERQP
eukprot:Gregarina_sp_Pseudo_9__5441@NODE_680_length_2382_cov_274_202305_g643_i0_p1_GENE_NODE_680_length_2382_cov_274_202305_g643_i0NODE_680_length_2382_cov_274_202305_g643_i0_p1_ORF_typecomplete_len308_score50_35DUF3185/PF11381_8/6_1e02DUF3185/PF11381_8/66DUF3185/PF11381_8/4_2L_HMGIC_fpl/PF10242_9/0_97_NODE_680_length_2382_cov_274_202305_g643_i096926